MGKVVCVYHANCMDGFGAAWAVRTAVQGAEFLPGDYGDPVPALTPDDQLIIVDFSYDPKVLIALAESGVDVLLLDHHKSAREDWEKVVTLDTTLLGYEYRTKKLRVVFSDKHSGAVLAWKWFRPATPVPGMLRYIEDRDLWKWALPASKQINKYMNLVDKTFSAFNNLDRMFDKPPTADADHVSEKMIVMASMGQALVINDNKLIETIIKDSYSEHLIYNPYEQPVLVGEINCPAPLASDACNLLLNLKPDIGIAMAVRFQKDEMYVSARSRPDGPDVSELARLFGGGGHKNAAGYSIK